MKLFGTDGIRGTINTPQMSAPLAMHVAIAIGMRRREQAGDFRPEVLIAKDTRQSGYMLENAMVAGFTSVGCNVQLLGPMPTPAVAAMTHSMRADVGIMLSASHNPYHDNGIKIFDATGHKISDKIERQIEADVLRMVTDGIGFAVCAPNEVGRVRRLEALGRYIELAKSSFPDHLDLHGMKVVVDSAHGAGYRCAPTALYELGAEIIEIGNKPDGTNINKDYGATAPQNLQQEVLRTGADVGVALDGDADRLILVDETGRVVDGDQIMALLTKTLAKRGHLQGDGLVATVMSNLGLERALVRDGFRLERTKVGDRFVLERMRTLGWNVGGEQSGHMILSDYATTGDGLIAALQVLGEMAETGRKASEVLSQFDPVPQLLKNVRYQGGAPLETESVIAEIARQEARLGNSGRVVIRPSGTEPVIRIMAEADDRALVDDVVDSICDAVKRAKS